MKSKVSELYLTAWTMSILFRASGVPSCHKHDLFDVALDLIQLSAATSQMGDDEIDRRLISDQSKLQRILSDVAATSEGRLDLDLTKLLEHGVRRHIMET